jgi:capsular exopolysaccharide synthesis family protein
MSHIFDALQRSEDERTGVDSSASSEAMELLRFAERRAAARWETADLSNRMQVADIEKRKESLQFQTLPEVTIQESPVEDVVPAAQNSPGVFPEFQTLQIALAPQNRLVCFDDDSLAAEAFRLLGVRLRHLRRDRPLTKVLITSTIPQEGKSMVAANLACSLALTTQQKVLLLEGDLRRPSLSQVFGLGKHPGLCECLQGGRKLAACIFRLESLGLWVLPAGAAQNNALELLQSGRMSAIMDQLTEWFDWIIIDSPPVLPMADTSVLARLADGILLVTRQGITEKRHLQRGLEAIESKKLIGALLNCSRSSAHSDYYYRANNVSPSSDTAAR